MKGGSNAKTEIFQAEGLLFANSRTQEDVARLLGRGRNYVTRRMNGQESWTFEDAAAMAGCLNIPRAEWADYFLEPQT